MYLWVYIALGLAAVLLQVGLAHSALVSLPVTELETQALRPLHTVPQMGSLIESMWQVNPRCATLQHKLAQAITAAQAWDVLLIVGGLRGARRLYFVAPLGGMSAQMGHRLTPI